MRNLLNKATGTAIAIAAAALLSSGTANAQATVIDDIGCGILATDYGTGAGSNLASTDSITVVTPSGNTQLTCFFDASGAGVPAKAVKMEGFPCGTLLGSTTDTQSIATPKGRVVLKCHVNGSS